MSMHTKEPWLIGERVESKGRVIHRQYDGSFDPVIHEERIAFAKADRRTRGWEAREMANARRIVTCVNACRGIDTEILEKMTIPNVYGRVKNVLDMERSREQRDELLAVLESLFDIGSVYGSSIEADNPFCCGFEEWEKTARAVIAKAKGGAV